MRANAYAHLGPPQRLVPAKEKKRPRLQIGHFRSTPQNFPHGLHPHWYAEIAKNNIDFIKNIRPTVKGLKKLTSSLRRCAHL